MQSVLFMNAGNVLHAYSGDWQSDEQTQ